MRGDHIQVMLFSLNMVTAINYIKKRGVISYKPAEHINLIKLMLDLVQLFTKLTRPHLLLYGVIS